MTTSESRKQLGMEKKEEGRHGGMGCIAVFCCLRKCGNLTRGNDLVFRKEAEKKIRKRCWSLKKGEKKVVSVIGLTLQPDQDIKPSREFPRENPCPEGWLNGVQTQTHVFTLLRNIAVLRNSNRQTEPIHDILLVSPYLVLVPLPSSVSVLWFRGMEQEMKEKRKKEQ